MVAQYVELKVSIHCNNVLYRNILPLILQTILDSGLERFSQRIEDLRKQIVSSPDKLRAVSLLLLAYEIFLFARILVLFVWCIA